MRIAIVGSGIVGLSVGWSLYHRHQVTPYERNGYSGCQSNARLVETAACSDKFWICFLSLTAYMPEMFLAGTPDL